MKIEIEIGVPTPNNVRQYRKYPWKEMQIGQSFFVPGDIAKTKNTLASSATRYKPTKFVLRAAEKDGLTGIRVWRIA